MILKDVEIFQFCKMMSFHFFNNFFSEWKSDAGLDAGPFLSLTYVPKILVHLCFVPKFEP